MNETNERFLKAILERVPVERIVEIHLFPRHPVRGRSRPASRSWRPSRAVDRSSARTAADRTSHAQRLEVHTAWYRLTRKGPERGKWEIEVKTQADAPLETVETVVRGAQERAGEVIEPTRLTGRELLALMSGPAWQTSP